MAFEIRAASAWSATGEQGPEARQLGQYQLPRGGLERGGLKALAVPAFIAGVTLKDTVWLRPCVHPTVAARSIVKAFAFRSSNVA